MILLNELFDAAKVKYKLPSDMSLQFHKEHYGEKRQMLYMGTSCGKPIKWFHQIQVRAKLNIKERKFIIESLILPFLDKHAKHVREYMEITTGQMELLFREEFDDRMKALGFIVSYARVSGSNCTGAPPPSLHRNLSKKKNCPYISNNDPLLNPSEWQIRGALLDVLNHKGGTITLAERNQIAKDWKITKVAIDKLINRKKTLETLFEGKCPVN